MAFLSSGPEFREFLHASGKTVRRLAAGTLALGVAGCAGGGSGDMFSTDVNYGLTDGSTQITGYQRLSPAKQARADQVAEACQQTVKRGPIANDYSRETAAIWSGTFGGYGNVSITGGAMEGASRDIRANANRQVATANQVRQDWKNCVESNGFGAQVRFEAPPQMAPEMPLIRAQQSVTVIAPNDAGGFSATPITVTGDAPGVVPSLQPTPTITIGRSYKLIPD